MGCVINYSRQFHELVGAVVISISVLQAHLHYADGLNGGWGDWCTSRRGPEVNWISTSFQEKKDWYEGRELTSDGTSDENNGWRPQTKLFCFGIIIAIKQLCIILLFNLLLILFPQTVKVAFQATCDNRLVFDIWHRYISKISDLNPRS